MSIVGDAVGGLAGPLFSLVDKLFTSDDERAAAKRKLLELEQAGDLETMKASLSAIIAEAQSNDPWTSRARPSFLYVIYIMILAALPMGVLSAFRSDLAQAVGAGVGAWLGAIPEDLWMLFGAGYLGYTGARGLDKWKGKKR